MSADETFASVRAAYTRYPSLFANFKAVKARGNSSVSWSGFKKFWISSVPTFAEFIALADDGQYSFQTQDGSLVQLFYEFRRRALIRASLALLKPISVPREDEDFLMDQEFEAKHDRLDVDNTGSSDFEDSSQLESGSEPTGDNARETRGIAWIRIDFDLDAKRGLAHPACHLHMHGFPDWRLAVRGVPTPVQFVDIIAAQVYPRVYSAAYLSREGRYSNPQAMRDDLRNDLPCHDAELYATSFYIHLPGVTQAS